MTFIKNQIHAMSSMKLKTIKENVRFIILMTFLSFFYFLGLAKSSVRQLEVFMLVN